MSGLRLFFPLCCVYRSRNGKAVSPEEWHRALSDDEEDITVLDCRNSYESEVGL